jgi:hypothetical protein
MNALASLAWKEWREARAFLWIALGTFVVLPVIGGIEELFQSPARFEISAYPWVLTFGGVLAVFVAVGATCRDFSGHLEDFWRSRPVSVTRWMLVKYIVGLAVVLIACIVPLAIELQFNREKSAILLILWFPFLWAALYSIGFLTGCLVRRTAHAATLALAAMLLVYFLPVVLPPLQWLNINVVTDSAITFDQRVSPGHGWPILFDVPQLAFASGMLVLAIIVLLLALLAVNRDWRLGSSRKMMYGSVAAVVLIIFASAAFQLGTNMPILRQIDLSKDEPACQIQYHGADSYLITRKPQPDGLAPYCHLRSIRLTDSSIELGPPIRLAIQFQWGLTWDAELAPFSPKTAYYFNSLGNNERVSISLRVAQLDAPIDKFVLQIGEFTSYDFPGSPRLFATGNRLYVIGPHLIVLDITIPLSPRVISDVPFGYSFGWDHFGGDTFKVILPPVPGLSPRQRFEAVMKPLCFDGDTLCEGFGDNDVTLLCYHLAHLTEKNAVFEKVGQYKPTILENMFGSQDFFSRMMLQNGLLYVCQGYTDRVTNPHVDVFDTRGPHPLRLIGHFAAPGIRTVVPLPDGTALVGGDKLWLIGPPPHAGSQ